MKCLTPIWIERPAFKDGGQEVPCGRCPACLQRKRGVWTFRMLNELESSESGYFITLTYDEDNLPVCLSSEGKWIPTLSKKDLQSFLKRLRARILKDFPKSGKWLKQSEKTRKWSPKLRYFACGEYGSKKDRPHYHLILYNLPHQYVRHDPIYRKAYSLVLEEIWNKGIVDIGNVERASAHYVAKYTLDSVMNREEDRDRQGPYAVMSRNPGIGNAYVNEVNKNYFIDTKNPYTTLKGGVKQPIGRYYKEKIFGDDLQREINRKMSRVAREEDRRLDKKSERVGKPVHEIEREIRIQKEYELRRITKKGKL